MALSRLCWKATCRDQLSYGYQLGTAYCFLVSFELSTLTRQDTFDFCRISTQMSTNKHIPPYRFSQMHMISALMLLRRAETGFPLRCLLLVSSAESGLEVWQVYYVYVLRTLF